MRANPFVKEIRLGDNECCSPGSANGDCKESYKGAVDILGCFERSTQVSRGEFCSVIYKTCDREGRSSKTFAGTSIFLASQRSVGIKMRGVAS
jgi:hypothetical protein